MFIVVVVGFGLFFVRLYEYKVYISDDVRNLIKVRRSKVFIAKGWRWGRGEDDFFFWFLCRFGNYLFRSRLGKFFFWDFLFFS